MSEDAPRLRIAVIGVGFLGTRHAEKLAAAPNFDLVAVHDRDPVRSGALAERLGCRSLDLAETLEVCEAAVVATSTDSHRAVADRALEAGRPLLVEKPLTGIPAEAEALVRKARERNLVLQVGHVERFNPAVRGLIGKVPPPLFVESHRLAPLAPRSLDIDVVQDLMVHDIDLALKFIGSEPTSVDASGVAVLSGRVDIANARLHFPGGVVANLTASRVSLDRVRKFRMFLEGTYVSADCVKRTAEVYRLKNEREKLLSEMMNTGMPLEMLRFLDRSTLGPEGEDPLSAEHEAFRLAIHGRPSEGVTGEEALAVLRVMVAVEGAVARRVEAR